MNETQMREKLERMREQNTRAIRKYREKNRPKINAISKKHYDTHKNNPEWMTNKREKQRLYVLRKNEQKTLENQANQEVAGLEEN